MKRFVIELVGIIVVASGCAGPAASAPAVSTSGAPSATPLATEMASPTPAPTLESTTEVADQAPPGAITLDIKGAKFIPDEVTAKTGTVVFFLVNEMDAAAHNMLIGTDVHSPALVKSETVLSSRSAVFTVHELEPGSYVIWCSIDDHLSFGMVGTLTVTP